MRRIVTLLLIVALFGFGTLIGLARESTVEPSSTKKHLDNLNLLVNLSQAGISTSKAATVDPREYQEAIMTGEITDGIETGYAIILAYNGAVIPDFLIDSFNRIFEMITSYLNLKDKNEKVVVWVMDFETLQQIPFGPESCFGLCPATLGALYAPIFNYLLLTPKYINEYHLTHELLHYFIDEYEEEVAIGLPQIIRQQYMTDVLLQNFLKQNEEKIVIELAQIIIRKSLASSIIAE